MKIFITGSSGFVGNSLVNFYEDDDVFKYKRENLVSRLEYFKPDLIINTAAEIYNASKMWDSNVLLTKDCLDYCVKNNNTTLIHIGSSSEYGPNYKRPTNETDALDPIDMYSGTKGIATTLCQTYGRTHSLDVTVIRPYSLYGPGEKPHRLFPNLWLSFKKGSHVNLINGVHDFCYIDDFVQAVDVVVKSDKRIAGDILNVSSGVETTNYEVLKTFQKVSEKQGNVTFVNKFGTQKTWQSDISKIKNKYGWKPKVLLEEGVKLFLERAYYE